MQRQVIDAVLQRDNPAVQQVARAHLLAAKVVDQQDAAVGLDLKRRFIIFERIVKHQIQTSQGQLAARHNEWAFDTHPARIAAGAGAQRPGAGGRGIFVSGQLVVDRIKHLNHLAVHVNGVRDVHILAEHQVTYRPGQAGLAVSGRAKNEHGSARIHRRTQTLEGFFGQHQVGQHLAHHPVGHLHATSALPPDGLVVHADRHRRGTGVLAAVQRFAGARNAGSCNGKQIGPLAQPHLRRAHLNQFFPFQRFKDLVNHTGEGQRNFLGNFETSQIALEVHDFQHQILQPER